jgi:tetratricopeptide (TPR) repeat protein
MSDQRLSRSCIEAGLQAYKQGDMEAAKDAFKRALAIMPDHPDALNLYGVTLLQIGQAAPALGFLQRAAHFQRNNAAVVSNLAQAYFMLKRYEDAMATFRKASRLDPLQVQFKLGIANSLAMLGQLGDAEILLRKLTDRFSRHALAWFNLGNVVRDQNRGDEALACYRRALELDPQFVDAHINLADMLHKLMRFEDAEREYRACLASAPGHLIARCNLASVVMDLGHFAEAEALCRDVVALAPTEALAHTMLGAAFAHQGRNLDALESFRTAAMLAPADAKAAQNVASTLADCGQLQEAMRWYARALALNPQLRSAHLLLGYSLLGQGRLVEGWAEYGHRLEPARLREENPELALVHTLPADVRGKHVCVMREQGLGDEIFFLRFAPQLHTAGARITYCASGKISGLLARVPSLAQVIEEAPVPRADADAIIIAGDLPHALSDFPSSPLRDVDATEARFRLREFAVRIAAFWPPVPPPLALPPLAARLEQLRGRLTAIGKPPYVGITWRGGTPPGEQRMTFWALYKEIGIAPLAAALKEIPGTFIALQRKPAPGEIDTLANALGRPVHDFTDLNEDLEGMLALLAHIDEYIGVSNTNMHLRASAGRTGRVLVPSQPDWRWMYGGRSSVWFPGFTVYRQSPQGDWGAALAALKRDLIGSW